jgi:uncharacterized protein YcgI (DUF1989 family)
MSEVLLGRVAIRAKQIKPGDAFASKVLADQLIQIIDVAGKQVASFVAFAQADYAERLSTGVTRSTNASIMLQKGMTIWSNRREPMFELLTDSVGRHDMLYAACGAHRDANGSTETSRANCRDALCAALASFEIGADELPDPVNWFMNVAIKQRGELEVREPLSERNDQVVLRALKDTVVAISDCPQSEHAANGEGPTDILVRVYR